MLSKNTRTHIVILRDGRKFNITQDQYSTLKLNRQDFKRNDPLEIRDADTKELLYDWEMWDIKEFQERKQDPSLYGAVYICDFWTRHSINEWGVCNCWKDFDCIGTIFKDKLKSMWYKIYNNKDITREMILEYKKQMS